MHAIVFHMKKNISQPTMSGYTLIEMSISLVILGIMSLTLFSTIQTLQKSHKIHITKHREQIILKALGKYVSTHNCLPYPCKPSEQHTGLSPAVPDVASDFSISTMECVGVVPWQTLGIAQEIIYDGYGNPFTYIMHPVLGKIPESTSEQPKIANLIQNLYGQPRNIRILANDFYYRLDSQFAKHDLYSGKHISPNPPFKGKIYPANRIAVHTGDLLSVPHVSNHCELYLNGILDEKYYKKHRTVFNSNTNQYELHSGDTYRYYHGREVHIEKFHSMVTAEAINEEQKVVMDYIRGDENYMHNHSDIIHKHQYDIFITLHYYSEQNGQITEHTIHDTPGENTFKLPLTKYNSCLTTDCVAVVLISHGTTGGHFDKAGNKTQVKIDISSAIHNANAEHLSPLNGGRYHIYLNSTDTHFDQHITYVTRFNFHLYGGPALNNHYLLNISAFDFDLVNDAYYFEHFIPPFAPLYKNTDEQDKPILPSSEEACKEMNYEYV